MAVSPTAMRAAHVIPLKALSCMWLFWLLL